MGHFHVGFVCAYVLKQKLPTGDYQKSPTLDLLFEKNNILKIIIFIHKTANYSCVFTSPDQKLTSHFLTQVKTFTRPVEIDTDHYTSIVEVYDKADNEECKTNNSATSFMKSDSNRTSTLVSKERF